MQWTRLDSVSLVTQARDSRNVLEQQRGHKIAGSPLLHKIMLFALYAPARLALLLPPTKVSSFLR